MIRAEARERLRESEEWEVANRIAAKLWTESVKTVETVEYAVKAFEPYYHYVEISNFNLACSVIIKERDNKWEEGETLSYSFYRLGLLQQMISAINRIINYIKPGFTLGRLYNTLGDLYCKSGNIHESIKCHSKSGIIASKELETPQKVGSLKLKLMRLKTVSFLNLGLCQIDLGEIEEAVDFFIQALAKIENYKYNKKHLYFTLASYFCLSFCYSYLGSTKEAYCFAKKAETELQFNRKSAWATAYRLLFLGLTYKNLGETEKSFEMWLFRTCYAETKYSNSVSLTEQGFKLKKLSTYNNPFPVRLLG